MWSTSSAYIRPTAKRVALEAEAKAMEEQHALELEALQVPQKPSSSNWSRVNEKLS